MRYLGPAALLLAGMLLGTHLQVRSPAPVAAAAPLVAPAPFPDFTAVARRVQPAVVSIDAIKAPPDRHAADPFFAPADERVFVSPGRVPSLGSGLIVREDGYILTNFHVVDGVRDIRVTFADDSVAAARLMGTDPCSDLALLKVKRTGLATVPWGRSEGLEVGQWVCAFGSPYRMRGSMSHGVISGKGRKELGIADFENFLQTDAAINPGNSGGPLVNLAGEVVGLNTAILSRTGASHGLSLAIPSELAQPVVAELLSHGRVARSWVGLFLDGESERGVRVEGGYRQSPAGEAGFQGGDEILELDGVTMETERQLRSVIASTPVGTRLSFRVWRAGRPRTVELVTRLRTSLRGI